MLLTFEIARKIQVNINFVDEILYSVYGIVASLFIIKKYGRRREKKNYVGNYFFSDFVNLHFEAFLSIFIMFMDIQYCCFK